MEYRTLRAFEIEVRRHLPDFRVAFKDESTWQKVLGFLMPLNQEYLKRTATASYPVVYFPTRKLYESRPWLSFIVLAHEMVHLMDSKTKSVWHRLSYFMPQVLAVLPLAAFSFATKSNCWPMAVAVVGYLLGCLAGRKFLGAFYVFALGGVVAAGVLGVLLTQWWSVLLFAGLALLAPWPSPWRTSVEVRAYAMNMAITYWALGKVPAIYRTGITYYFTGSSYYYMDWSGVNTRRRLDEIVERAQRGELQEEQPFDVVYSFMRRHKLLHAP